MGSTAHPQHSLRASDTNRHHSWSHLTFPQVGDSFVVKDENYQDQKLLRRLMCSTDTEDIWAHTGAAGSVCKTHTLTSLTANVLWVAFPARANSLSDESQENNTFNHPSSSLLQHLNSSMVRRCQNKRFGFFEVPDCLPSLLSFHWCSFFHYTKCCTSYTNNVRTAQCL